MGLFALGQKTAKELIGLGYPESVAKRIADGTLPMDEASKEARANLMGMGPTMFRGHQRGRHPQSNQDMWMSDDPDVARTYAMGGEYYDEATDTYKIREGMITPLRHNAKNLLEMDAKGQHYEDIYAERSDFPDFTDQQYEGAWSSGTDGISESVKAEGTRQGSRFTNILDDFDADGAFEPSTVENVLGTRNDVQIRSPMAAFDPEYTGSNILGGSLLPIAGVGGAASMMQSEDAEAGVSFGLAKNVDMDRLISAWRKAVSREPDINPSTHLQNIIHNKEFTNYNDWTTYARQQDGGKNGDTYFNELKPFLLDISKHPSVTKDNRLKRGLVEYADSRFVQRKKAGKQPSVRAVGAPGTDDALLSAQLNNHDEAVNQHMMNIGVDPREDPRYDYGTLLPVREDIVTGKSEMAMPSIARDMIRGLFDIAESRNSGVYRPDGLVEFL